MQEIFGGKPELIESFKNSLSIPRYERYIQESKGNDVRAIELYQWNAKLSQSLYFYLQGWEICLRNKLNNFLCWKYNANWPYFEPARRNFKSPDRKRLFETIERQESERKIKPAPTSVIVADLSAGFWVSQLSSAYDIPYSWRYNLRRIFPNDNSLSSRAAWALCDDALSLRNRVAHHEPVFQLPLEQRHENLRQSVSAMCAATFAYCEATCTFREIWADAP